MSKNRESGTDIQRQGMALRCMNHEFITSEFSSTSALLIAKSHPLQWCEECKKGSQ